MHGEDEQVIPGHALTLQDDKPFRSLQLKVGGAIGKLQTFHGRSQKNAGFP